MQTNQQSKQFQLDRILDKIDSFKGYSINSKMFLVGFIFHKYNLHSFNDAKAIFQIISSIDSLLDDQLITSKQKTLILNQVALFQPHDDDMSIKQIQNQITTLIEICINDKVNGTDYFSKKAVEDENEKLIKLLLLQDEQQKKKINLIDKQNLQIALKIQQEQQLKMKKKVSEASKIKLNMDCPICLQSIQLSDLAFLSCSHSYHQNCIAQTFKQAIDNRNFPLKCPNSECGIQVLYSQISEYLSLDYRTKYQNFTFRQFVDMHHQDMSWCPSPGCTNVFIFEDDTTEFNCAVCHKTYCLKCKVQFHTDMTCKQFQINRKFDANDQKFINFVKGAKYKQCPSCKFWVQKNEGCDHMTCRCKFQFCYVCGGVYGNCQCVQARNRAVIPPPPPPMPIRRIPMNLPIGKKNKKNR